LKFTKMHGLGNDFIVVEEFPPYPETALFDMTRDLCDRRTGVGADGVLVVLHSNKCAARMRIINADGSEAEMCGNGIRCFAKYVYERGLVKSRRFPVETLAGQIIPELELDEAGKVKNVRVNMGSPLFDRKDIPMVGEGEAIGLELEVLGKTYPVSVLRVGVPHAIVLVDDPLTVDLATLGPAMENHPLFPARTNVDFVHVQDRNNIVMRTWERGAGATLACGTGACCAAVACMRLGLVEREANVHIQLGSLLIQWQEDGSVYMSGPAEEVFTGDHPGYELGGYQKQPI